MKKKYENKFSLLLIRLILDSTFKRSALHK